MIQMRSGSTMNGHEKILGVEGGGTKTAWVLVERDGADMRVLKQGKLPPSNFRLATPERLHAIFSELPKEIDRAGIFLAGCVTEEDRRALSSLCVQDVAKGENHHRQRSRFWSGRCARPARWHRCQRRQRFIRHRSSWRSHRKSGRLGAYPRRHRRRLFHFCSGRCASFCANTTCTAAKRSLPRVFCALWR